MRHPVTLRRILTLILTLSTVQLTGCAEDPMEACLKQGMERKLPPEGSDRGAYIKAREQVRMECERKLR